MRFAHKGHIHENTSCIDGKGSTEASIDQSYGM